MDIKRIIHNESKELIEYVLTNKLSEKQENVLKLINEDEHILCLKFLTKYPKFADLPIFH